MKPEEDYFFDVMGYLIVRDILTPKEVEALNQAMDRGRRSDGMLGWPAPIREPFRDLLVHPRMVGYLHRIVGEGFRLDRGPELLPDASADEGLVGGNEPRDPARAYYFQNGRRFCQGLRAIWALADVNPGDGGFVLLPYSHKSNVETPKDILTGKDVMGLTVQPALKAGDLLLCAETLLFGLRHRNGKGPQRLLSYQYAGRAAIQSIGTGPETERDPYPDWMSELTREQQRSLYVPGYESTTPPPTLVTDGKRCRMGEKTDIFHPSIYIKDPNASIDEKEFYFWDLCGVLILRDVMDAAWLEAANEVIDRFEDRIVVGEELSGGSKSLSGTGRPVLDGLLQLPKPHCEPFRKMVAHPVIEHRLNWMGASGGRMGGASAFCSVQGTSGHAMHGNNEPMIPSRGYEFQNGRSYCQAVTVTWQLRDVNPGDGGFACVPGSHKANYPMPRGVETCKDHMGLVMHQVMKAGDVLFFMDGATTHGTLPWSSPISRRGILIKYSSRSFHRAGGEMVQPENRWGDLVDGMNEVQLAVMRGPDRDVHQVNVPRLRVENGKVGVSYGRGNALYSTETPKDSAARKK